MMTLFPRPLRRAHWMLTATTMVFVSAAVGVVIGPVMPRAALAAQDAQSTSTTYKDVYDGWKWWHVYCYRCHGTNAIATATAPSLIEPSRQLSAAQFLKIVREGLPDKGMQAWDKLLDPKQIRQIHLYVRARTDKVLPPGRPDEVGPDKGLWEPPDGWPKR